MSRFSPEAGFLERRWITVLALSAALAISVAGFLCLSAPRPAAPRSTPTTGTSAAGTGAPLVGSAGEASRGVRAPLDPRAESSSVLGGDRDPVRAEVEAGGAAAGARVLRFVDARTGAAVASLEVSFTAAAADAPEDAEGGISAERGLARWARRTDAAGEITLAGPSTRGARLDTVDPYAFLIGDTWVGPEDAGRVLRVGRGGAIRGRLLSATGAPLAESHVESLASLGDLATPSAEQLFLEAPVDEEGCFLVRGVPVNAALRLEFCRGSTVLAERSVPPCEAGATTDIGVILLPPLGWIHVSSPGLVGPATAIADAEDDGDESWSSAWEDGDLAEGIRLGPLPAGRYTVGLRAPSRRPASRIGVRIEPGVVTEVQLELLPGLILRGRLRTESGAAVRGSVSVRQAHASAGVYRNEPTDADGGFELTGLAPGPAMIRASVHGSKSTPVSLDVVVAPEMAPVEIVIPSRDWRLRLTLDDGAPVTGEVWITDRNGSGRRSCRSDAAGVFVVPGEADGSLDVLAWSADRRAVGWVRADAAPERSRALDVRLSPATTLTVQTFDARSGRAIGEVELTADGRDVMVEVTDDLGFARVTLLADESSLVTYHPHYEAATISIPPRGPRSEALIARLTPRPAVAGVVLDMAGAPVPGVTVSLGRASSCESREDGSFSVSLPSLTWVGPMTVTPPDHRRDLAAATLEVPADPAARESIRVTLPDARAIGGSIAGRVVDLGDYGVTSVHARPYDPRDLDTRGDSPVDDDGRFEVLALEPGRYVVVANSSSGIVAAAEVDVVDGRRQELGLTTGRATLRVRVVSARGAAIPHREFRVATPVGARTGPELGVARYVDAGGVLDLPVPSGLRHLVFVGEDDEEALAIADVTATAGETREVVLIVDDAGG